MANSKINIVISAEDKASKPLRSVSDEMDNGTGKASKFKSALGSLGGVLTKATLAAGALALAAGTAGGVLGFQFNSSVEQAETKLTAFMKDGEKVAKTLAWVKDEAALTQFSFTEMADAAANLTPVARSSGKSLEELVKQAEILAALNPAEGLTGATFSLREALSGDWVSITDRFNLPRTRINQLKAEGVPAMEIISKTLKEMGIDYSLVAKQGQTVSARFDQVKDKLTMMAGAAAKPIFDRVSRELDTLGAFDYSRLGDNLAGIVSGAITMFDEFAPKAREVGKQIGDYLGPKFESLWTTVNNKVLPVVGKLWNEVLVPFGSFLGTTLVVSIGGVVDILNGLITAVSWVVTEIQNGNPWVVTLAGAFAGLGAAMALSAAFSTFTTALNTLTTTTIPGVIAKFTALKLLVTSPLVMPAIAVGAALAAIGLVYDAAVKASEAVDGLKRAKADLGQMEADAIKTAGERYRKGEITKAQRDQIISIMMRPNNIGNASGTNYWRGGESLVGEHGPEIVRMPQGAQVTPAYRSRNEGQGSSGVTVQMLGDINVNNGGDYHRMLKDIGFQLELAS